MRTLRNLLLGLLLVLAVALGALVVWRVSVLEAAGEYALAYYGFDQASLAVTEVDLHRIVAENVDLGPDLPSADRVELRFQPLRLVRGELERVVVTKLQLVVQNADDTELNTLVSSENLGTTPAEPATNDPLVLPSNLPPVELRDAEIQFRGTPAGNGVLKLTGEVTPGAAGLTADIDGDLHTAYATAALSVRTEERDGANLVVLESTGEADASALSEAGALAERAAALLKQGRVRYVLTGQIAAPQEAVLDSKAWLAMPFALKARLDLDKVQSPFADEFLSGTLPLRVEGDGSAIALVLPTSASVAVTGVTAETLERIALDLPPVQALTVDIEQAEASVALADGVITGDWTGSVLASARLAEGEATLTFDAAGEGRAATVRLHQARMQARSIPIRVGENSGYADVVDIEVAGSGSFDNPQKFNGTASLSASGITTSAAALDRLEAATPFDFSGPVSAPILNADGLSATATGLSVPDAAAFVEPLALTADQLRYESNALLAQLVVAPGQGEVMTGKGAKPVSVAWERAAAEINAQGIQEPQPIVGGGVSLTGVAATVPEADIRISDAAVTLPFADGPVSLTMNVSDLLRQGRFTPVSLRLEGERAGNAVKLSGDASMHGGSARVPLMLTADVKRQSADVRYGPAAFSFMPGALQPKNLSSSLRTIQEVTGKVTVSGTAGIDPAQAPSLTARVVLEDVSANLSGVQAEGLSGTITLPSVRPLATAGEQTLTLRRVVAGVPLENVRAIFAIPKGSRGQTIVLREASADLAGGTVTVGRAEYRDGAADLQVEIAALPLERLLREWKIEGLSGTGLLSGTVPVRIRPAGIAIGNGHLDGQQPGVLQVNFGAARDTLTSAGEQVELAVRTLEDFHYKVLSLDVSKPLDGELSLAIRLEGNNPAVLDGHPFVFNINLSGRLEPILEAIQAGERISADLLRGGLGQ